MQSITELAATRKAAYYIVNDEGTRESVVEKYFKKAMQAERKISTLALQSQADVVVALNIVSEEGEPDWDDPVHRELIVKLLASIPRS